ncbi:MAG: hypothetical protein WD070_02655 [Pirellulaceae bacterium]
MRFAIIGCHNESLGIVRAIVASDEHQVVSIHNADECREPLSRLLPAAVWSEHWESLLVSGEVDAVVMTPHAETLVFEDQCRKLVQAGVPIIASHPMGDSLFAYELEMMREEVRGSILAYFPGAGHPAFEQLAQLIDQGDSSAIGVAEQLVIERYLPERDRASVLPALAQGITLQRQLIGQISSISAVGAEPGDLTLPNLSANVTGTSKVIGRWSVAPATDDRMSTITLIGSRGTAIVTAYDANRPWSLRIGSEQQEFAPYDAALAILDRLQPTIAQPESPAAWEAICHDLDATEQIERSLRRKRTIELRRDAQNEEGAFKGIMSAGGCVVLLLALFLLMVFAVVEGVRMPLIDAGALREEGEAVPRMHVLLRLWPVYPLAAFLLLQLLVFFAKKPKASSGESSPDEHHS